MPTQEEPHIGQSMGFAIEVIVCASRIIRFRYAAFSFLMKQFSCWTEQRGLSMSVLDEIHSCLAQPFWGPKDAQSRLRVLQDSFHDAQKQFPGWGESCRKQMSDLARSLVFLRVLVGTEWDPEVHRERACNICWGLGIFTWMLRWRSECTQSAK